MKPKKCRQCKDEFTPTQPLQVVCSFECAIELNKTKKTKEWRKEKKARQERLKTTQDYVRELQVIFNRYIRLRDKGKGCISCGKPLTGKYDAGHYYSTGSYPELRFHELNVWGQDVHCNQHKRGNLIAYGEGLEKRIGKEGMDKLKALAGTPRKYTIPELKELKEHYKQKIKELEN